MTSIYFCNGSNSKYLCFCVTTKNIVTLFHSLGKKYVLFHISKVKIYAHYFTWQFLFLLKHEKWINLQLLCTFSKKNNIVLAFFMLWCFSMKTFLILFWLLHFSWSNFLFLCKNAFMICYFSLIFLYYFKCWLI